MCPYFIHQVETIGDAYMVVGGVPERKSNHAASVCSMGLDMVYKATEVISPATGKPLQVNIYMITNNLRANINNNKGSNRPNCEI